VFGEWLIPRPPLGSAYIVHKMLGAKSAGVHVMGTSGCDLALMFDSVAPVVILVQSFSATEQHAVVTQSVLLTALFCFGTQVFR
jgi:hypothetical protein